VRTSPSSSASGLQASYRALAAERRASLKPPFPEPAPPNAPNLRDRRRKGNRATPLAETLPDV
jgi:hypothetical protein